MVVIKKPVITEKTVALAEKNNQYTFEVSLAASKVEATKQLEELYKVSVEKVTTKTRLGKTYRFGVGGRKSGKKNDKKFMTFQLKEGNKIEQFQL